MELKQLAYFIQVCETNSFTEAAHNCFISAQGVNIAITRLENELGVKLFDRTSHGIYPTKEGAYLLPKARMMLQISDECTDHFSSITSLSEKVSLVCVRGTVELLARPAIYEFNSRHPEADIDFTVTSDMNCRDAVLNGTADLALCVGPVSSQSLSKTLMYSTKSVLVVNKKHPYARKKAIGIDDLKDIKLAIPDRSTNSTNTLLYLCQSHGFTPDYSFIDEPRMASYLADMNLRCGISSMISAQKLLTPNTILIPIEVPEMDWRIYLLKNKERVQSKNAAELEKILLRLKKTL